MPIPSRSTLTWSELHQQYELHTHGTLEQCFSLEDEFAFCAWLEAQTSFAFAGQSGRLSVLKETRARGSGYWYAYRRQGQHPHKGYLGPSSQVTFARLEELASRLTGEPSSPQEIAVPSSRREKSRRESQRTGTAHLATQKSLLLSTKFSPPRLPSFLVERSGSLTDLEAVRTHVLTLVSASAGSGKTTLLSTWSATARALRRGLMGACKGAEEVIAWLSLDSLDNDPIRFWDSVIAALRRVLPSLGEQALALLHAPQSPPLSTILTTLLNELVLLDRDLILLLDDYHLIREASIHEGMLFLLDHLPTALHLVLATRSDPDLPLSRFRVRGHLHEIRDQELRFTLSEAATFLVQGMGLPLSEENVATLHQRTGGWIAGLYLAALSARKREDLSAWVSDFGGSHRYLLDYVQQDILARLPSPLQNFLLQTSVVSRMNAALCQAVTAGSTREASQQMLEEVEQANLFVVPLDEHRQWYRYHDLFRQALHARLQASQPELVPLLHVRAARWYEAQGELREAIDHALSAADYAYAASLMKQAAPVFWLRGEVRTVHKWVLSLPDAILRAHVRLALSAAFRFIDSVNLSNETLRAPMAAQVGRTFIRMEGLLREKQRWALSEAEVALIERRLDLLRAWIELREILKHGDSDRLRQVATSLETLPSDEEVGWDMIPLSFAFWLALPQPRASTTLIPRLREAAQRMMEARDYQMAIRVKTMLAVVSVLNAQLHQAQRQCLEGVTLLQQIDGHAPWEGHLYYSLFSVSYACNRLEEASHWLGRMLEIAQDWQQVELLVRGQIYSVRLALAKGDLPLARQARQKLETLIERDGFALHIPWISVVRVQVWLAEGNLVGASAWVAQTTFSEETWNLLRRCEVLMLVRVLLAQQQNVLAVENLERFHPYFERPGALQTEVEWMALSVVALHRWGKRERAIQVATRLLTITEPESYVRLDLDTGEPLMKEVLEIWLKAHPDGSSQAGTAVLSRSSVLRMLSTLEQDAGQRPMQGREASLTPLQSAAQHTDVSPLSRREQQVLRLLVAGQTYAEMAQALIVSPNTIKTQVSSIYRKLGVSKRAEAIAMTAHLHLL